jgi:hypothetical protein
MVKKKTKKQRAAKAARRSRVKKVHTYRSGLEDQVIADLEWRGILYEYETVKVPYTQPSKARTYNPDIMLKKKDGSIMYIEVKGKLDVDTRYKHQWIKQQYPDMDLRFVFGNWSNKIMKGSPTSYKDWSDKMGIPCANKYIPEEWLEELI